MHSHGAAVSVRIKVLRVCMSLDSSWLNLPLRASVMPREETSLHSISSLGLSLYTVRRHLQINDEIISDPSRYSQEDANSSVMGDDHVIPDVEIVTASVHASPLSVIIHATYAVRLWLAAREGLP